MTENRNFNSQTQVPITCCQKIWTSGQVGNNGMVNSGLVNPGQSSFDGQVLYFCPFLATCMEISILATLLNE